MTPAGPSGPLSELTVLDCSGMIAGGFATMQLADFGADVILIEHPDFGDPLRDWPPFDGDISLWWKSIARNKRCITLDLGDDEGREVLLEFAADADVLFENFRPGTMEAWGLGPDDLHGVNPGLVIVRISGYGQTGPRANKPGFGTVAEGISGWAHANGFPDREPLLPPISLADITAAQYAVQATMFAVFEREAGSDNNDEGQVVDISLYEPLFRLFIPDVEAYDRVGYVRERNGNRHESAAPRNIYETTDGFMTLSASSQPVFERVMEAVGRPDLIDDPRFATNERRVEHAEALDDVIEEWTRQRSTEAAIRAMESADAIVGPVYDITDIFADEQYRARENVITVDDPDLGPTATPNVVPRFSRTPGDVSHLGPEHGAHNEAVYLDDFGMDRVRYERLRESGVI